MCAAARSRYAPRIMRTPVIMKVALDRKYEGREGAELMAYISICVVALSRACSLRVCVCGALNAPKTKALRVPSNYREISCNVWMRVRRCASNYVKTRYTHERARRRFYRRGTVCPTDSVRVISYPRRLIR